MQVFCSLPAFHLQTVFLSCKDNRNMKQIERVLSVEEAEELKQHLRGKKFSFRNRFGGYEEAIHYTANTKMKVHFLFFPHINPDGSNAVEVKFHIDNISDEHHKLSRNPHDYERVMKWLSLPSELAFDLTDVFSTAKERWVAKRFRSSLGGKQ